MKSDLTPSPLAAVVVVLLTRTTAILAGATFLFSVSCLGISYPKIDPRTVICSFFLLGFWSFSLIVSKTSSARCANVLPPQIRFTFIGWAMGWIIRIFILFLFTTLLVSLLRWRNGVVSLETVAFLTIFLIASFKIFSSVHNRVMLASDREHQKIKACQVCYTCQRCDGCEGCEQCNSSCDGCEHCNSFCDACDGCENACDHGMD